MVRASIFIVCVIGASAAEAFTFAPSEHSRSLSERIRLSSSSNNNNEYSENTPYRSIGEVVGGLHGGKYQFEGSGTASDFALPGPSEAGAEQEQEHQELPKWALRMKPSESADILDIPSNANRLNGMIRSAQVTITNDERTWEQFHARVIVVSNDGIISQDQSGLFLVRPSNGNLAPRGGASNACDANQPYSDTATLQVIHNENVQGDTEGTEYWLLVGTEEEQSSYRLRLPSD